MEDPVTAPDGETYERASLERGDGATALLAKRGRRPLLAVVKRPDPYTARHLSARRSSREARPAPVTRSCEETRSVHGTSSLGEARVALDLRRFLPLAVKDVAFLTSRS